MNKTQILCNNNNRIQILKMKQSWKQIMASSIILLELNNKKEELTLKITKLLAEGQKTAFLMVRLGRIQREIGFWEQVIRLEQLWIKDYQNKLVIC